MLMFGEKKDRISVKFAERFKTFKRVRPYCRRPARDRACVRACVSKCLAAEQSALRNAHATVALPSPRLACPHGGALLGWLAG